MLIRFFLFFNLFVCSFAFGVETVELEVAQSYVFSTPENSTLKISRKGVVEVFENSPGQWNVTGLRKGLISISWLNDREDILGRIYIHVSSFGQGNSGDFPHWICKRSGVSCDLQVGVIDGITNDEFSWLRALKQCEKISTCVFKLTLSSDARKRLQNFNDIKTERYVVRASVVLADRKEAEKLGITPTYVKGSPKIFEFDLSDQVEKRNLTLLGEPAVLCRLGQSASIRSGGEVESFYQESDKDRPAMSYWKKYGLMLEVKLSRSTDRVFDAKTRLELSRKSNGGLQSHELETTVSAWLGKRVMLGVVEFQSDESSSLVPFHLGSIPIIGPWFKFRTSDRVFSLMAVFLTVKRWVESEVESQK